MKAYNIQDVKATEELFVVLSQFDKTDAVTSAMRTYKANKKKK